MMKDVCQQVKNGKKPLVSFVVDKYESAMQQHIAGNGSKLLGALGQKRWNRRAILIIILLFTPVLYMIMLNIISFMYKYFYQVYMYKYHISEQFPIFLYPVVILFTVLLLRLFIHVFLHMTYFEFREEGVYYINEDCHIKDIDLSRATIKNNPYPLYNYLPYDHINKVKFTFQSIGRITGGDEIFENIFIIFTNSDEAIRIDSGVLGSQENIKMTACILKEKSNQLIDPYHIFEALELSDAKFYAYLKKLYEKKHPPYRWKRRNKS